MSELEDTVKSWPLELQESYDAISLPSMHDFVVSQEKLAAEVRKQNKELKTYSSTLDGLSYEIKSLTKQTQASEVEKSLMAGMDALLHLLTALEQSQHKIMQIVPVPSLFSFCWTPKKHAQLKNTLNGYVKGVNSVRQKLLMQLCDMNMELICPQVLDPFNPDIHRAVEKVKGEKSGTIACLIRYGYKTAERVLRFADVAVYY